MKRQVTGALAAGLSLALLTAPLAMAQDQGDDHGGGHAAPAHAAPAHAAPAHAAPAHAAPAHGAMTAHREAPAPHATPSRGVTEHRSAPAARPPMAAGGHNWRAGSRYTGGRNVVDYNRYHLRRPPAGYEWVQDGNQFVLIAISTGIIASVLAASGY